jgi:adenylate cyclase
MLRTDKKTQLPVAAQKKERVYSGRGPVLFSGLALVTVLTLYFFFRPGLLETANNRIYDILLRSIPHSTPSSLPVIVDIDDESLKQSGQWPWPRYRIARLLEKINALGPRSVALDMFFPEPDRTSLDHLQNQIERDFDVRLNLTNVDENIRDNDAFFAQRLAAGPFVLGYKFVFDTNPSVSSDCLLSPAPVFVLRSKGTTDDHSPLMTARGAVCNINELSQAVTHQGFTSATPDGDGVLRRVPLLITYKGKTYPSLALAAMLKAFGTGQVLLRMSAQGTESITIGNRIVPLDEKGNLLVRFRGPANTFRHISAAKFFDGRVLEKDIKDRIVFIGTSASGLRDFHTTPFDSLFPGVEAHAAIIDNLVQGDFIKRARWMRGVELILGVIVGILSAVLLAYGWAVWSIFVFVISLAGMWFGSNWLLASQGIFISPFIPLSIFAVNFSFLSALKFWWEERQGKKQTQELVAVQAVTLETIAMVIETRHTETGGHVRRTQHYVKHLAEYLQKGGKYSSRLDDETVELLFRSSPLHDVGKVGVPDSVLKKPGKLTAEEFEVMKQHTVYGKLMFDEAESKLGHNSFLSIARTIAYTHHEKWDGSGYPQGLKGEGIPLYGRIMAVADIYDALTSKRLYKKAMPHDVAAAYIKERGGKDLDATIVDAFLECEDEFRQVAARFVDGAKHDISFITP